MSASTRRQPSPNPLTPPASPPTELGRYVPSLTSPQPAVGGAKGGVCVHAPSEVAVANLYPAATLGG